VRAIVIGVVWMWWSACTLDVDLGSDRVALALPPPPPPTLTCDQQVDFLASMSGGGTGGVAAIGYAAPGVVAQVDPLVQNTLASQGWPSAAIAVTLDGTTMLARGYGSADITGAYAEPDSMYRLASVSKTLTAMAIMNLASNHVLTVGGTPAAPTLPDMPFAGYPSRFLSVGDPVDDGITVSVTKPFATNPASTGDGVVAPAVAGTNMCATDLIGLNGCWDGAGGGLNPQLPKITIDDLLYHEGGWDRDEVYEVALAPMIPYIETDEAMEFPYVESPTHFVTPPTVRQKIQFLLNQPVQFAPGSHAPAYSNIGYGILGEIISETSGEDYFQYITDNILTPLKMSDTLRAFTLESQAHDREVTYYGYTDTMGTQVGPSNQLFGGAPLPAVYGGSVDTTSAPGSAGWISSAIDLARYTGQIEAHKVPVSDTNLYYALSTTLPPNTSGNRFGEGWDTITPSGSGSFAAGSGDPNFYDWEKDGGMTGTTTRIKIFHDGFSVVALFNASGPGDSGAVALLVDSIDSALSKALSKSEISAPSAELVTMYDEDYTTWQDASAFSATLASAKSANEYPWRIDGRVVSTTHQGICTPAELADDDCPGPITIYTEQYRARLAPPTFGVPTPYVAQTCTEMATTLASTSGQLVSLQKFWDDNTNAWSYQAVIAP
jgi:CubicO group peptidase (beta-lactamase class C family)